jgi:hypothetical protein
VTWVCAPQVSASNQCQKPRRLHVPSGGVQRASMSLAEGVFTHGMSEVDDILGVIREAVLDEPDHQLSADGFATDPMAWRRAAEDWGITMVPLRATAIEAQGDAERCRDALVVAGWADQASAEVSAHLQPDSSRWRGGINLTFGLLPPMEYTGGVRYERVIEEK